MRNIYTLLFILISSSLIAQVPGDTIVVNSFNYASLASKFNRDTMVQFPTDPNIKYSKVIMLYNMRCKDGLISPGIAGQTNIGCGEWDYSCNTYLTDSSRVDSLNSTIASHNISDFTGTTYNYVSQPYYNKYQYPQVSTNLVTINSETQSVLGSGTLSLNNILKTNSKAGRSQYLFTAAELLSAGVVAGLIDGILLDVTNAGTANFLEVNMKHTTDMVLNAGTPHNVGFTNVFMNMHQFTTGINRLQFANGFLWDGISNVVLDFSFTNSIPSTNVTLSGNNTGSFTGLIAGENNFINTAGSGYANAPASAFANISNQITIAFWSKGNTGVSTTNTSIIEGVSSNNARQANIHLPWSNGRVYWDCGNTNGTYDRIDKQAVSTETEGTWQHWAFTKNTTTGVMNIYLNGVLWHTGTGKVAPINITKFLMGIDNNLNNIYRGAIDEMVIFNTELSAATIASWMYKSINSTHPNFANVLAYYPLNEGIGGTTQDASVNAATATFVNPTIWNFVRGNQLNRFFTETMERPNVIFAQGNYTQNNVTTFAYDSLQAIPNFVKTNTVFPNVGTMKHDSIGVVSNQYWAATYSYVYDAITGAKLDSTAIIPTGSINITQLPYVYRYPSKFELMSFVTPYGINLDLGMQGKTWTFDMTDYLPILQGNKRLTMERGGERQEDMDIKFLFIVGTPTRDVKAITQLWRQPSNCNYNEIISNKYFEPRNVPTLSNAKYFKTRTMVTGHGQEGEFIPRQHYINVNGGVEESIWTVEKKCGYNPVYPHGGTWIYDRAGWCPGMATDLHETDITSAVTPGSPVNVDYGMYTASGTSNYLVSNYLVQYGDYNFSLDEELLDVLAPTNKVEYAREQAICAKPQVRIQNTGSTILTSVDIEYWVNSNAVKSTYQWTGNLLPNQTVDVSLPSGQNLWSALTATNNQFNARIVKVNNAVDQYPHNNTYTSQFTITGMLPLQFIVYHKSNLFAAETSYKVIDEAGNIVLNRNGLANNTVYRDTLTLPFGCYKLLVEDTDGDGISFWANSDGAGSLSLRRINGTLIKTFNPDFGGGLTYNFTTEYALKFNELFPDNTANIYPNPTRNSFTIEADNVSKAEVTLYNNFGQKMKCNKTIVGANKVNCTMGNIPSGIYTVSVINKGEVDNYKLVVE